MLARVASSLIVAVAVGCAAPSPSSRPERPISLQIFDGRTCPSTLMPTAGATIRIDRETTPGQVVGIDGRGERYEIWWPEGFTAGFAEEPVVLAVSGAVVARDGDKIQNSASGPGRLNGYSVCALGSKLYVQLIPPS